MSFDILEMHVFVYEILILLGVHTVAYAFPHVKIVTSAIDPELNERFHVLPGIGNFGDRYSPFHKTLPKSSNP